MVLLQAKSEEVSHVQATWEHHENTMIDAQLQLADLKLVLAAAQKAEAEAQAAREAAEAQLAAQSSELDKARSRLAGAEAQLDEVRSQVGFMTGSLGFSLWVLCLGSNCIAEGAWQAQIICKAVQPAAYRIMQPSSGFVWFSMTKVLFKASERSKLLGWTVNVWAVRAKLLGSEANVLDASPMKLTQSFCKSVHRSRSWNTPLLMDYLALQLHTVMK